MEKKRKAEEKRNRRKERKAMDSSALPNPQEEIADLPPDHSPEDLA